MVILDTDVCIEMLRGNTTVIQRRREYVGEVAVSFMTAAELFFGAAKSSDAAENTTLVEQFLLSVPIIMPDLPVLRRFGTVKAQLQASGAPLADADVFIGATALSRGARLVTGNARHFERMPGLALESWV